MSTKYKQRNQLRKRYLQQIRDQVLANINSFTSVDEFGQDVTPEKIKEYKRNQFYPALMGSNLSVSKAKRQIQDSHLKALEN